VIPCKATIDKSQRKANESAAQRYGITEIKEKGHVVGVYLSNLDILIEDWLDWQKQKHTDAGNDIPVVFQFKLSVDERQCLLANVGYFLQALDGIDVLEQEIGNCLPLSVFEGKDDIVCLNSMCTGVIQVLKHGKMVRRNMASQQYKFHT